MILFILILIFIVPIHGVLDIFPNKASNVCTSRIQLAIDNSATIGALGYSVEKTYITDTANGLLTIFNQSLLYNYYYLGDDFHGVATYSQLVSMISTIPQTIGDPHWNE